MLPQTKPRPLPKPYFKVFKLWSNHYVLCNMYSQEFPNQCKGVVWVNNKFYFFIYLFKKWFFYFFIFDFSKVLFWCNPKGEVGLLIWVIVRIYLLSYGKKILYFKKRELGAIFLDFFVLKEIWHFPFNMLWIMMDSLNIFAIFMSIEMSLLFCQPFSFLLLCQY